MLRRQFSLVQRVVAYLWDSEGNQVLPQANLKTEISGEGFHCGAFSTKRRHAQW